MKKRVKQLVAAAMTVTTLCMAAVAPTYANEEEQYPLKGTFPYTLMTKEIVDKRLAEGWVFTGDPYADVGTATPFQNNEEWSQVNYFKNPVVTGICADKILVTLAGLKPGWNMSTGSELTAEEEAVKNEVIKYLSSYDWKNASEYEKAYYTAEYIASRSKRIDDDYNQDNTQDDSVYAVLINGRSVYAGFTQTYHLLTRAVGLKSVDAGDTHNYVMISGQWYEIDVANIATPTASMSIQDNIDWYLKEPATDTDQYLWVEMGIEGEFDSTLPDQPTY